MGVVMRGQAESERVVYCHEIRRRVPFRVYECSEYEVRGTIDLDALRQMAWLINKKKGVVGFRAPKINDEIDY